MTWGPTDRSVLTPLPNGVTAAAGFRAAGIAAGLKPSGKPDLALVVSDCDATVAVTTTTNRVKAAPCVLTERHAADGHARAVIINSGNANACTGPAGFEDAEVTAVTTADALRIAPEEVLVCSTGIIGVRMPIERLLQHVPSAVGDLSADGGPRAARAILTTDTVTKEVAYRVEDAAGACTIGAMAKGAGMIEPAMATLIVVITTDAPFQPAVLKQLVRQAVSRTFNRISVDSCGSTNDTVAVLANGQAERPPNVTAFRTGLEAVCADLARMVVEDGEGTTKVAEVRVTGARTEEEAVHLARAIAGSVLFRAALHGADPNWGRVLAAMGSTPVAFEPERVAVTFAPAGRPGDGVTVCRFGVATAFDRGQAAAVLQKDALEVLVDVGLGSAEAAFLTADLTPQYVAENAYYTT